MTEIALIFATAIATSIVMCFIIWLFAKYYLIPHISFEIYSKIFNQTLKAVYCDRQENQ